MLAIEENEPKLKMKNIKSVQDRGNYGNRLKQALFTEAVVQRCSVKKGVLRNSAKLTGEHLLQSLFLNKVAGLRHRCFSVNFAKFSRTPFLQNTSGGCFCMYNLAYFFVVEPF